MTEEEKNKNRKEAKKLQNQKSAKKTSINKHEQAVAEIDAKLKRLRKARDDIRSFHNQYKKNVRKKDDQVRKGKYKWKGSWYNINFKQDTQRLDGANEDYLREVDHRADQINTEIGRLERERASHKGIISQLWAEVTSLGHQIENLLSW